MDARLFILALGSFAGTMESFVLPGVLPSISDEMGISASQAGLLALSYSVAYAVAAPVLASLFGAADRRSTLSIAELIFGLCALAMALAPLFSLVAAGRALLACGAVLFTSMAQATAIAMSKPEQRGRAVSVVLTGGTLAVAIGAPLGALFADQFGWRATYVVIAMLGIASGLLIWFGLPRGIRQPALPLSERFKVLGYRGVPVALSMSFLYMVGAFAPVNYIAAITTDAMGLERSLVPLALFANGLGSVGGGVLGGQLVDRVGPYRTFVIVALVASLCFMAVSGASLLPPSMRLAGWLLLLFLIGVCHWSLFGSQVALFAILVPASVPVAMSLNLSAVSIGVGLSAVLGGYVLDNYGASGIGLAASVVTLASAALAVANGRTLRGQR